MPRQILNPEQVFGYIRSADLLGFVGKEHTSRFIRWWGSSRYSHVGLAIWITDPFRHQRLCVSDAVPGEGVRLVPIESFVTWPGLMEHFEVQDVCRKAMVESAFSRWMYAYPTKNQFFRSFGGILTPILDWLKYSEDLHPCAVHCAEHLSLCCADAGVVLQKPAQKMTPGAVVDLMHNGAKLFESTGRFSIRVKLKTKA